MADVAELLQLHLAVAVDVLVEHEVVHRVCKRIREAVREACGGERTKRDKDHPRRFFGKNLNHADPIPFCP